MQVAFATTQRHGNLVDAEIGVAQVIMDEGLSPLVERHRAATAGSAEGMHGIWHCPTLHARHYRLRLLFAPRKVPTDNIQPLNL
jgi:hypothetical protein